MSQNKGIEKINLIKKIVKKECGDICSDDSAIEKTLDQIQYVYDTLEAIHQHRQFKGMEERRLVKELEKEFMQLVSKYFEYAVDLFFEGIITSLRDGLRVVLYNFMTFETSERKEICRRAFGSDESVVYPATKTVKCKVSNILKRRINEEIEE